MENIQPGRKMTHWRQVEVGKPGLRRRGCWTEGQHQMRITVMLLLATCQSGSSSTLARQSWRRIIWSAQRLDLPLKHRTAPPNKRPFVTDVSLNRVASTRTKTESAGNHLTEHMADIVPGQRSQDSTNLLQGQGLQEAHPAQGHPSVAPHCAQSLILNCGRIQGRQGFAVCPGKASL
jgi:hypothetical protein